MQRFLRVEAAPGKGYFALIIMNNPLLRRLAY
jgi:hypothetical protein